MTLFDQINEDIKKTMLAREKEKLEALRAVKAALLLAQTEKAGVKITPDAEIKLLQKLVKQRRESADIYNSQNRKDLADKESFEADVISAYLPAQLSDAELENVIRSIIERTGASSVSDTGKVMGIATKELAGKAEGKRISEIVRNILSEK